MEKLLLKPQSEGNNRIALISGSPGVGKSALAYYFATIYEGKFPDGVIAQKVDGKDIDAIAQYFVNRLREDLDREDKPDASTLMQEEFAHRQMLLIFDNADEASIKSLLPGGERCAIIVTARNRNLAVSLKIKPEGEINLTPFSQKDSLELFQKKLGENDNRIGTDLATAQKIVDLVGNLPLALEIVGAALRGRPRSLADYAASLQDEKTRLSRLKNRDNDDLNIEASFNISLKLLSEEVRKFFVCLSVCAENGFSRQIATAVSGCSDEWLAQDYLDNLFELSLLNYSEAGENRFVFHTLIRLFARDAGESSLLEEAAARHADYFIKLVQSGINQEIATIIRTELDNIIIVAKWLQHQNSDSEERKERVYNFALCLQPFFEQYGYWQQAVDFMRGYELLAEQNKEWDRAIKFRIQQSKYLSLLRKFSDAENILENVTSILEKIDNESNRKISEAKYKTTLGTIYVRQNRFVEAISNFENAVEISENLEDLESLSISLNSLGAAYRKNKQLSEAEIILNRALKIDEEAKFDDPKNRGYTLHNLGKVYQENRKLGEALSTLEKSRKIFEELNLNRSLLMVWTSIGYVLQAQKKFNEAIEAFQQSAALSEEIGDPHDVVEKLKLVASALLDAGRLKEAQEVLKKQITLSKKKLGDNHRYLVGLNYLGKVFEKQDKIKGAVKIYRQQIKLSEACNDMDQLRIGIYSLRYLAETLYEQKKFDEAQQATRALIEISLKPKNNKRLATFKNFSGKIFLAQGKFEKAKSEFFNQINIGEIYGNSKQIETGLRYLRETLIKQGSPTKANSIAKYILEDSRDKFQNNNDSKGLLDLLKTWGSVFENQPKWGEAEKLLRECFDLAENLDDKQEQAIITMRLGQFFANKKMDEKLKPAIVKKKKKNLFSFRKCIFVKVSG